MSLSVKSIASWSYTKSKWVNHQSSKKEGRGLTLATPKFSIEGILCPIQRLKKERKKPIYQWYSLTYYIYFLR